MTDRSIAVEERRRLILAAAVRVFARKGYHACRVGEIAEEAGISHGLLYHYFASKEEVLETIFGETWSDLIAAMRGVEESDQPAPEKLRQVAAIFLRAWRREPDLVRVLVHEVARSPQLPGRVVEIGHAFRSIERIVEQGQEEGELRRDVDARLASWILYGAIEEILTGWVLGQLADREEDVAEAERTVVEVIAAGLAPERRRRLAPA